MRIDETLHHCAFSIPHRGHTDAEPVDADSELLASPDVIRHLRRVNYILAGKTCDVGTGPADIFALDHGDPLSLSGEGPGQQFRARTASENEEIINLGLAQKIH